MGRRTRTTHSPEIDNIAEFMDPFRDGRPRTRITEGRERGQYDNDTDTSFWEG